MVLIQVHISRRLKKRLNRLHSLIVISQKTVLVGVDGHQDIIVRIGEEFGLVLHEEEDHLFDLP